MQVAQPGPRLPLAPPRTDMVRAEDSYQAYWAKGNKNDKGHGDFDGRKGFPLPPKAHPVEGTVYKYIKSRDDTGSEAGNVKKQQAYDAFNEVGDTRRLILHSQSSKKIKKNKKVKKGVKGFKGLATQLNILNGLSLARITDFVATTGLDMRQPDHFQKFPELLKD